MPFADQVHELGLIVAALSAASGFFGFSMRRSVDGRFRTEVTKQQIAPSRPKMSSNEHLHPVNAPPNGSARPSDPTDLVLQVGAMKNANKAVSLEDALRQKKFSVFVTEPSADSFYRVFVGPYSDNESVASAEAELRRQGFSSMRRRNPQGQ